MIVSETPKRSHTRWLQACVLVCAMLVLPLGVASAQDYEAVGKRLREAVRNGELSREQAGVMMDTLRRTAQQDERGGDSRDWDGIRRRIGAAIESGDMTREEAAKRMEGLRRRMAGQADRGERRITREGYARVEAELRKAVAAGKISGEDARARLEDMRKMMAVQGERKRGGERKRITREDFGPAAARLRKAVAEGKISGEDARARLEGMRKMMAEQGERQRTTRGDKRAEYEGFERRIKAAVEAGKMTREEAGEKLEAYKKRIGRGR